MTEKYLYGAAVQGIQEFIFKTNKLKEIVGASELVERICTNQFYEASGLNKNSPNLITTAAGNIKCLLEESVCKKVVLDFPKQIMEYAPGITISQAVVKIPSKSIDGETKINTLLEALKELEKRLKAQRNKATVDVEKGLLITERSRRTGLPAIIIKSKKYTDRATNEKQNAVRKKTGNSNDSSRKTLASKLLMNVVDEEYSEIHNLYTNEEGKKVFFNYETDTFTQNDERSYIAVIHADGNNLGKILQQLSDNFESKEDSQIKRAYRYFSKAIDEATIESAQKAFYETFNTEVWESIIYCNNPTVPFRPIVLSGDDLTVLCEAKYAIKFTKIFLQSFVIKSEEKIKEYLTKIEPIENRFDLNIERLTACAGIAFIKNKYPFHYAVSLAEELCGAAKKESKRIQKENELTDVPSSLAFYKVESTFHTSYNEIKERVLTTPTGIDLCYGPYFLDQEPKIETLRSNATDLNNEDAPSSQLRKWLSELHQNKRQADLLMQRTVQVLKNKSNDKYVSRYSLENPIDGNNKTVIYDIVSLASLIKKQKEDNDE